MAINQGLVLTCAKCSTKNFLDPYPFWNFSGNTKCASCDTIYAVTFVKGQLTSGPTAGSGKADLLPGYAEDKAGVGVAGEGKIRPAPQSRPDPFSGKQKHIKAEPQGKAGQRQPAQERRSRRKPAQVHRGPVQELRRRQPWQRPKRRKKSRPTSAASTSRRRWIRTSCGRTRLLQGA